MHRLPALALALSLTGCSIFFDPNDHVGGTTDGGRTDGGGVDGGAIDGGFVDRPDVPACEPDVVNGVPPVTCATAIESIAATWPPMLRGASAPLDLGTGASLRGDVDVDIAVGRPEPEVRVLHLRTTSEREEPVFQSCVVDRETPSLGSCEETSAGDSLADLVDARWVALTHEGQLHYLVVGDATAGTEHGVWIGAVGPTGDRFGTPTALGQVTLPPWGEVALGGWMVENRRSFIPEPPGVLETVPGPACVRANGSIGALSIGDDGSIPSPEAGYTSFESEALCNANAPCTQADGLYLDATSNGMMIASAGTEEVLVWDGSRGRRPATLDLRGRAGAQIEIESVGGEWYVVAYGLPGGYLLTPFRCTQAIDLIDCCSTMTGLFATGLSIKSGRIALAHAGGTSVAVAWVDESEGMRRLKVTIHQLSSSGFEQLSASELDLTSTMDVAAEILDLAADGDLAAGSIAVALTWTDEGAKQGLLAAFID
jgi:hypothetical protein